MTAPATPPPPAAPSAASAPSPGDAPSPDDDLGFALPPPASASRWTVALGLLAVVGGAAALALWRRGAGPGAPVAAVARGPARVETVTPTVVAGARALTLPGVVRPLEQAAIRPRVAGYVRRWLVDLGDAVAAGQLLAEIDTPELDAQLAQARAQVAQARAAVRLQLAQRDYARASAARVAGLAAQRLVSQAQVEQAQAEAAADEAGVAAAEASVAAAEAGLRRLSEQAGFARVVAPFAGRIAARGVERGALVGDAAGPALFTLVASDPVRVFVEAPQSAAAAVAPGQEATITVREQPGHPLRGKVTRAAGALDPDLHTRTVEVQVPNPDGALLPGTYVQVELALAAGRRVLELPATALLSDAQGTRVAVVDAARRVHLAPVTIERDTGATIQLATGLTGDERVVKLGASTLVEGQVVDVAP